MYPWPIGDTDPILNDALRIAMDYLSGTGQAENYTEVQRAAAKAILTAWRKGVTHRIRLSNAAIVAVQNGGIAKHWRFA
jgi:hypothetical protein